MSESNIYAHSLEGIALDGWQTLSEHSCNVAKIATQFAASFGSSVFGNIAGQLHDLGKARSSFQNYLLEQNGIDAEGDSAEHSHSIVGACWAANNQRFGGFGRVLAYLIAGHHAGLADWSSVDGAGDASLKARLNNGQSVLKEREIKEWVDEHEQEYNVTLTKPWCSFFKRDMSFWIRMLYSCLVDADFLDTEAFMNAKCAMLRGETVGLSELSSRFFDKMDEKERSAPETPVNAIRAEVRKDCRDAAEREIGLFSLTVPTGGGKTLASMEFALRHALKHGLRRVIYVIPYTSIIEQTSAVLKGMLGDEMVLEHHSNLDPKNETLKFRLASENWDAPIIVTTAVQFFESIYANRSSKCRKLHNIVESVVIIDEAQLLPVQLLLPITEAIHQLSSHYKCSIVLCTATQPSLNLLKPLQEDNIREIISPGRKLFQRLKRVEVKFPKDCNKRMSWNDVAEELKLYRQVLCVVNTRRHCRELYDLMPEGTMHLSASMCGEHRSRVIAEIKRRLSLGEEVRVISTQLVEAGVDIDFPVVYRAMSGLASIVQTAGRCNREGLLDENGEVKVFVPPEPSPKGDLRFAENTMLEMLACDMNLSVDDESIFERYFRLVRNKAHDLGEVFDLYLGEKVRECQFQFAAAAKEFQMIDTDGSRPVIVRYGDADKWISALRKVGPTREIMRHLQRYTVNLPINMIVVLLEKGGVVELEEGSGIFIQEFSGLYADSFGVDLNWAGPSLDNFIV